jgi:hypothetical protein
VAIEVTVATIAVAMIGPMPGIEARRRLIFCDGVACELHI